MREKSLHNRLRINFGITQLCVTI